MFKLPAYLCFGAMFLTIIILLIVILTTPCIEHKAIMLIYELDEVYNSKLYEFGYFRDKVVNGTSDVVKAFDVKAEKDLNVELQRLNGIIDGLKKKSSKCVEEQESRISNLSDIGRLYSTCSEKIVNSTERKIFELHVRLGIISISHPSILSACLNEESCIELVETLERNFKTFQLLEVEYTKQVRDLMNKKMKELEECSKVSELKNTGEDIIEKINVCAGLKS